MLRSHPSDYFIMNIKTIKSLICSDNKYACLTIQISLRVLYFVILEKKTKQIIYRYNLVIGHNEHDPSNIVFLTVNPLKVI